MIAIAPETQRLLDRLLVLPANERIAVAQALWDSVEVTERSSASDTDEAFLDELMHRDAELESGAVTPLTHEELMAAVRKDLACDSATIRSPGVS